MIHQSIFSLLLGFATLSTALVAGLVFTFAVIIMPGIAKLEDSWNLANRLRTYVAIIVTVMLIGILYLL